VLTTAPDQCIAATMWPSDSAFGHVAPLTHPPHIHYLPDALPLALLHHPAAAPAPALQKDLAINGSQQLTLLNNLQPRTEPLVAPGLGLPFANMFHTTPQPIMNTNYTGVTTTPALSGSPNLLAQGWRPLNNARDNMPCNTLFIGNLGENTREEELHQLMGSQPGFR